MYDNARYLINVHHRTLYIQRKRSIYVSSNTIHGKYPLCLKICVISGICEPYPFCLTMAARPPLRSAWQS